MPNYQPFSGSSLRIEVEGGGGAGQPYSPALMATLRDLCAQMSSQVNQLSDEQKPTEVFIEFGLRGLSSGGYAICIDRSQANFRVQLKWGGQEGGGLGGIIPAIPG